MPARSSLRGLHPRRGTTISCMSMAPAALASSMRAVTETAGASLAVTAREQGGIAGVINATGAITWIVAPVSATALYGWMPLSPFLLALALVALSCACAWWLLHRADIDARARN